jgi:methyl-accepting chemotaxis protein
MSGEKPVPETLDTIASSIRALGERMESGFAHVDVRFAQIDRRFEQIDARFGQIDARFVQIGRRLEQMDRRFAQNDDRVTSLSTLVDKGFAEVSEAIAEQRRYTEFAFGQLRAEVKSGYARLDRKLDRVLNTLTRTPAPRRRRR